MRMKHLFLGITLVVSMMPFTSCSKDDEPKQTVQDISVANTSWCADNGATIKFYSDGTCQLGQGSSASVYHQVGNEIDFERSLMWYNKNIYYVRRGYINGTAMSVELYSSKEPLFVVNFYKVG